MKRIGIIGAGVSGLAAAWALREGDCEVIVFDKSRGVSGRAASRSRDGVRYDHGANYFKTDSPQVEHLVREVLPTEGLVDIGKDVWTFNGNGAFSSGEPMQNADPKWTYRDGISTLGKRLAEASEARIQSTSKVESFQRVGERWRVLCAGDEGSGLFDAIVLTPPAPQSAEIMKRSSLDPDLKSRLVHSLEKSRYYYQMSCVLAFEGIVLRADDYFALVNTDRQHSIAWLSFEEDKPGHVPPGRSVVVVQMAPGWSEQRSEQDDETVVGLVMASVRELLDTGLPELGWFDIQRWRFAHPASPADVEGLRGSESAGLFFAGDALVGQGRIPRAIVTGLECAEQLIAFLGEG